MSIGALNIDGAVTAAKGKAIADRQYFVSAVVRFEAVDGGALRPVAHIEVSDAARRLVRNCKVLATFSGAQTEAVIGATDGAGTATLMGSALYTRDNAFVALQVDGITDNRSVVPVAPLEAATVDRLSFMLLVNLGEGLGSSAVALNYGPSAVAKMPKIDPSRAVPTYNIRSFGTNLVSSTLIFATTPEYYASSGLWQHLAFFTSGGTGLSGSPIILDEAYFNSAALAAYKYDGDKVWVRSAPTGSGLISSAVIWKGASQPLTDYFTGLSPMVLRTSAGVGLISSAVIWNGGILSDHIVKTATPTWLNWSGASYTTGTGLISSAIVLPYSSATVTGLGFNWQKLVTLYPMGTGLISSALIARYNPYAIHNTAAIATPIQFVFGTGEAPTPLP
jgi:hypothetical protein